MKSYFNKLSFLIVVLFFSAVAHAQVHTWHVIKVNGGQWKGSLKMISEEGSFVNADGSPITTFSISANEPVKYGFQFNPEDDFNVAYTLTLTHQDTMNFVDKTCVFMITAKGPADPDVQTLAYNGAKCSWSVVPRIGEDFNAE